MRDGASATYALFLKSRLIGENPCHVDRLFRKIKQFGGHARQAGGVCGVEMALWDLAGKAYGVPAFQMLGGRFRDQVRLYADTTETPDGREQGKRLKARMDQGFTFLKQDFGIDLVENVPGTLSKPLGMEIAGRQTVMHPFTGITRHGQGPGPHVRLHRRHPRGDRDGDSPRLRPLRPHRRELLHPPGPRPWRSTSSRGWKTWCPGSSDTC